MRVVHFAFLILSFVVLLAGCSSKAPHLPDDKTIRINLLLNEIWSEAGQEQQCLSTSSYSNVDVAGPRYLVFRGNTRGKAWLNKLRHECPGLRRDDTLLFELHGGRACDMDRVSVIDRFMIWRRTGPTCILGEFRPISADHLERITEMLRSK